MIHFWKKEAKGDRESPIWEKTVWCERIDRTRLCVIRIREGGPIQGSERQEYLASNTREQLTSVQWKSERGLAKRHFLSSSDSWWEFYKTFFCLQLTVLNNSGHFSPCCALGILLRNQYVLVYVLHYYIFIEWLNTSISSIILRDKNCCFLHFTDWGNWGTKWLKNLPKGPAV